MSVVHRKRQPIVEWITYCIVRDELLSMAKEPMAVTVGLCAGILDANSVLLAHRTKAKAYARITRRKGCSAAGGIAYARYQARSGERVIARDGREPQQYKVGMFEGDGMRRSRTGRTAMVRARIIPVVFTVMK